MATSPIYGFEEPDDTDLVKDGALAIRTMGNAIDSTLGTALNNKLHAGLVLVKSQTVGAGVSSVTVTGAFSATYDDYLVIYSGGVGGGNLSLRITLGSASSAYYANTVYGVPGSTTVASNATSNGSAINYVGWASTNGANAHITVKQPFLTKATMVAAPYCETVASAGAWNGNTTGSLLNTTSYADFTLTCSTSNITGGTICIYGYAKD